MKHISENERARRHGQKVEVQGYTKVVNGKRVHVGGYFRSAK